MNYEKIVELHKASYIFWNGSLFWGNFQLKKEYTIFDYLSYQPAMFGIKLWACLDWLWNHRKRWIVASKQRSQQND